MVLQIRNCMMHGGFHPDTVDRLKVRLSPFATIMSISSNQPADEIIREYLVKNDQLDLYVGGCLNPPGTAVDYGSLERNIAAVAEAFPNIKIIGLGYTHRKDYIMGAGADAFVDYEPFHFGKIDGIFKEIWYQLTH